jgi:hypothetical protein
MKSSKFALFSIVMVLLFITTAFLPESAALAQDDRGLAKPTPISPHDTILSTMPTYKWTKITGATIYQYQVYKGTTKILDKSPDYDDVCGTTTCEKMPNYTLGYNVYKWRVRAYKAGVWSAWSAYMFFTVSPPGFNSQFNGTMSGWARKSGGTWTINSNMWLYTLGIAGKWSAAYKTNRKYSDFDYEAKLWRNGKNTTYIAARMGPSVGTDERWYPGYIFGYTNTGDYAVFRLNTDGSTTTIQGWTLSATVHQNDWNTLRVVAKGNQFWYYINGTLVKTFTDSTFTRGFVGVQAYRNTTTTQYSFFVDYAKLTPIETVQE